MTFFFVIPVKAGIQTDFEHITNAHWIPAFAGMMGRRRFVS